MANNVLSVLSSGLTDSLKDFPGAKQARIVKGQSLTTPALPAIKQQDLKDPNLIQLNQVFNLLWAKIVYLAGGSGSVNIPNDFTAQTVSIPTQTQVPTDNTQVITLGSALALFSPSNTRTALTSGAFQTNPTTIAPAQPLPQTNVSAKAPTSSTAPGTPGQIAFDNSFFYICVAQNSWRRVATSSF